MAGKNLFNSVKMMAPKRSTFDLSHDVKLTCNMGELIPFALIDCMPGDSFSLSCQALVRFLPMIAPVMHMFNCYMHWFFVPKRIIWNKYEKWITSGNDTSRPVMPYLLFDGFGGAGNVVDVGDLADYLGIPPGTISSESGTEKVSALPFAAYQMIYNEYYRDQNLVTELYPQGDSPLEDLTGDVSGQSFLFPLRKRAWEHDYFTSALPFAQKGTAVSLPLGNVELDPAGAPYAHQLVRDRATGALAGGVDVGSNLGGELLAIGGNTVVLDPNGTLVVGATLINDLRRAYALQRWLERNALGGTRFIEFNKAHYNVHSSDKRLQRPEYITGSKTPIMISEVLNTTGAFDPAAPNDPGSPVQGNMAGHAVGAAHGRYARYFCEEQGFIMGIMSIMPRSGYMQGIDRMWYKIDDPTQEYFGEFAHIGEQEILNKEIYAYLPSGTTVADQDGTFGYVPRYAEYKFLNSRAAGDMRANLSYWTAVRRFSNKPALNQAFIEVNDTYDNINRIFAVPNTRNLVVQIYNGITAKRGMPKYGNPV